LPAAEKKDEMKRLFSILLALAVGCAPWTQVGGLHKNEKQNFSAELPQGWMKWNESDNLIITRDGLLLQYIQISRVSVNEPLKNTKKKVTKGMMPHELAEVVIDDMASNQNVLDFQVLENSPIKISEIPGFRLVYTYKKEDGLRVKSIYCGCLSEEWLYAIVYTAPQRYYFDKDADTFEKVLASFRLKKT
jgi:hypothetical protein